MHGLLLKEKYLLWFQELNNGPDQSKSFSMVGKSLKR